MQQRGLRLLSMIWNCIYVRLQNSIAVRSAARLGHGDFGVNRKRVENLRLLLPAARCDSVSVAKAFERAAQLRRH
jgi:hypothetical protein